jgi:stringent starvation protein B
MMPAMNVGPTATKKSVLEQLLDQGMVLVALDARIEGVVVPPHLGRDAQLRLNLSYRFGLPMSVDDWGILATLTFSGTPFNCRFPWDSVFLLVSHVTGQPYLFPDDIPPELLSQATAEAGIDAQVFMAQKPSGSPSGPPKLQLVRAPQGDEDATPDADAGTQAEPKPRPAAASRAQPTAGIGKRRTKRSPAATRLTPEPNAPAGDKPADAPDAPAAQTPQDSGSDTPPEDKPRRRPSHLRVVK